MLNNIVHGIQGYTHYKGGLEHLSFIMHRVSGLGTLLFLSMHILLESTAHYAPHIYDRLNAGLRTPFALLAEILMAFLVIFHGVNGYRIAYFDLFHVTRWSLPAAPKAVRATWIISLLLWLPAFVLMLLHGLHMI